MAKFANVKREARGEAPEQVSDEEVEPIRDRLDILTKDLIENYETMQDAKKRHEGSKDEEGLKQQFFSLASEYAEETIPREKKTVHLAAETEQEARSLALRQYPTYRVVEVEEGDDDWAILLESDPAFDVVPFINSDGYEVKRAIGERGASFDVEGFMEDHPDIAEEVIDASVGLTISLASVEELMGATFAELQEEDLISVTHSLNEGKASQYVKEHPESMDTFADYRIPGTPSVSLPAPKAPKKGKR